MSIGEYSLWGLIGGLVTNELIVSVWNTPLFAGRFAYVRGPRAI